MSEDDPMARIRAQYHRHERQPIPRFISALHAAGCHVTKSRMRGVEHEVAYDGMCIGTISKEGPINVLELSKRETPARIAESVAHHIERSDQAARAAMRTQMGIVR